MSTVVSVVSSNSKQTYSCLTLAPTRGTHNVMEYFFNGGVINLQCQGHVCSGILLTNLTHIFVLLTGKLKMICHL